MRPITEDKDLNRLLVLMPHRSGQISDPTGALIHALERAAACVVKLPGHSDIGLARCLLAGGGQTLIEANPGKWDVVLWLDSDMYTDREVLFRQLAHLHEMNQKAPKPAAGVCVSGIAVRRTQNDHLAGNRKVDTPVMQLDDGTIMCPGYTGMACLMMTVPAFTASCKGSPILENDSGHTYPGITKTGPALYTKHDTGKVVTVWRGEDWNYCDWQWQYGNGVWFDPSSAWGHLSQSMAIPLAIPQPLLLPHELEEYGLEPIESGPATVR